MESKGTAGVGMTHRNAYYIRSDKYYYSVSGQVQFTKEGESFDLNPGDIYVIFEGQKISYQKDAGEPVKLIKERSNKRD